MALRDARAAGASASRLRGLAGTVGQAWASDRHTALTPEHAVCLVGYELAGLASDWSIASLPEPTPSIAKTSASRPRGRR